ncbi:hypothetical protein CEXT_382471 [Caerostris extrusa]|uniref:MD-2-related lipid-recognition domain-containing protein n=1 Tax=Caerostris extrusa TaxID=172846 RepID=A0AAV4T0J2_CAEEX|nr:hypothetical protein CEXT_382471 [Caerostris extrusa]
MLSNVSIELIGTCDSGRQILNIKKFSISPDPVHLTAKEVTISMEAQLAEDIPTGARIQVKIWKVTWIFGWKIYIPAPCVLPFGCDVEHCKFLKEFSEQECPFFVRKSTCGCPIKAQTFKGDDLTITVPPLGGLVRWFASGHFWLDLKIADSSGLISCYSFEGEARS